MAEWTERAELYLKKKVANLQNANVLVGLGEPFAAEFWRNRSGQMTMLMETLDITNINDNCQLCILQLDNQNYDRWR
jgi:hypothetical protein